MKHILAFILIGSFLLANCRQSQNKAKPADWATDRDLVCGMKVQYDTPDTVHYQGKVYGFCSPSCKEDFLGNPQSYVDKTPEKQ